MARFFNITIIALSMFGATGALAQSSTRPPTPPPSSPAPRSTAWGEMHTRPQNTFNQPSQSQLKPTTQTRMEPWSSTKTSASFSDDDVRSFATAVVAVQDIQQNAKIDAADKQAKMASAVHSAGLTSDKFNEMVLASRADPALMDRVQTAVAANTQASGEGATADAPAAHAQASGKSGK